MLYVAYIQRYIKSLFPQKAYPHASGLTWIGVFRPGLLRPVPLADGSLLEAETYASEERSVLVAGVGDVVLEGVDHPDVGTDTEVDLAEFKSGRGVRPMSKRL